MKRLYNDCYFFNNKEIAILGSKVSKDLNFFMILILNWIFIEFFCVYSYGNYFLYKKFCFLFLDNEKFNDYVSEFKQIWYDCYKFINVFSFYLKNNFKYFIYFWHLFYKKYPLNVIFKPYCLFVCFKFFDWRYKTNYIKRMYLIREKKKKNVLH